MRYVGAHEFRSTEDPDSLIIMNVTLAGEALRFDVGGKDPRPMTPLSEMTFSTMGGRLEFVPET